jgi:hypothetical protein
MPQPRSGPLTFTELKSKENLFFVGTRGLRWDANVVYVGGLTLKSVGKYEIPVVYSSLDLPVKADRPFGAATVISNTFTLEVLP